MDLGNRVVAVGLCLQCDARGSIPQHHRAVVAVARPTVGAPGGTAAAALFMLSLIWGACSKRTTYMATMAAAFNEHAGSCFNLIDLWKAAWIATLTRVEDGDEILRRCKLVDIEENQVWPSAFYDQNTDGQRADLAKSRNGASGNSKRRFAQESKCADTTEAVTEQLLRHLPRFMKRSKTRHVAVASERINATHEVGVYFNGRGSHCYIALKNRPLSEEEADNMALKAAIDLAAMAKIVDFH